MRIIAPAGSLSILKMHFIELDSASHKTQSHKSTWSAGRASTNRACRMFVAKTLEP